MHARRVTIPGRESEDRGSPEGGVAYFTPLAARPPIRNRASRAPKSEEDGQEKRVDESATQRRWRSCQKPRDSLPRHVSDRLNRSRRFQPPRLTRSSSSSKDSRSSSADRCNCAEVAMSESHVSRLAGEWVIARVAISCYALHRSQQSTGKWPPQNQSLPALPANLAKEQRDVHEVVHRLPRHTRRETAAEFLRCCRNPL